MRWIEGRKGRVKPVGLKLGGRTDLLERSDITSHRLEEVQLLCTVYPNRKEKPLD